MFKNCKITLSIIIISFLTLGVGIPAFAENASTTNSDNNKPGEIRRDLKNKIEEKRTELKDDIKKARDDAKEKIEQFREKHRSEVKNKIQKELQKMSERFGAALERLEKLATRIDARIVKLKADGKSTTEAEGFVADAKAKLAQAKIDIGKLPLAIDTSINLTVGTDTASSTPAKDAFKGARELAKTIKQELLDAHKLLVKAVISLKGLGEHRGDDSRKSTTTMTTTP